MSTAQRETIWRVVFPSNSVGLDEEFRIAAATIYGSGHDASGAALGNAELHKEITGRTSLEVPSEHTYSTASYYNAFPAAYWAQWTNVQQVVLNLTVVGEGSVTVHRSDADANDYIVAKKSVNATATSPQVVQIPVPIDDMAKGGWLWFDIEASADASVTLSDASWQTEVPAKRNLTASLAITTMNKPEWCIRQFNLIDAVYVVDQGSN